jgi:hypothetical protein
MTIKAKKGIREISSSGGYGEITDRVYGHALLKEQASSTYNSQARVYPTFNKDRNKALDYGSTNPVGGQNILITARIDPANISTTTGEVSRISLAFGQSYTGTYPMSNNFTISPDDDFVLISSGFYVPVNPDTYVLGTPISFANSGGKKIEIINANNFVSYNGQNILVFTLAEGAITLEKTIAVSFDIVRVNAVSGHIVAVGLNDIIIIDPAQAIEDTDEDGIIDAGSGVIYSETTDETLTDVICIDGYAFVKTLSNVINPVYAYSVSASGVVNKLPLSVHGTFPVGGVISLTNIVRETTEDIVYALVYESDNVQNVMASINITKSTVKHAIIGADVMPGAPQNIKPVFYSGNRIAYASYTSGQPGYGQKGCWRYDYTEIEHRVDKRLFRIVGLG